MTGTAATTAAINATAIQPLTDHLMRSAPSGFNGRRLRNPATLSRLAALHTGRRAQSCGPIRPLPWQVQIGPPKVAVRRHLAV